MFCKYQNIGKYLLWYSEQKVSRMMMDVAGQFIQMVESEEERQTHLDIACAAWNISIL